MEFILFRTTCQAMRSVRLQVLSTRRLSVRFASSNGGPFKSYLITPKELSTALSETSKDSSSRIIPLCSSWFAPNDPECRTGMNVFKQKRLPNAVFFDINEVKDASSVYPHMLPTAEEFAAAMSNLGLRKTDRIVVYDSVELGIFSAPRAAWTLKVFGHPSVHILNNFKIWVQDGFPTESGEMDEVGEQTKYPVPSINPDRVACFRDVKSAAKDYGNENTERVQIIDARSPGRFIGKDPEPRPGVSSGHVPGSINLPLAEILDPTTKAFLPSEELKKLFESKGLDPKLPIITTCGTGVMACALDAALGQANFGDESDRKVYDGSWT